jgi:hypothetical protein
VTVNADEDGRTTVPVFYGIHSVSVGNKTRQVDLTEEKGRADIDLR